MKSPVIDLEFELSTHPKVPESSGNMEGILREIPMFTWRSSSRELRQTLRVLKPMQVTNLIGGLVRTCMRPLIIHHAVLSVCSQALFGLMAILVMAPSCQGQGSLLYTAKHSPWPPTLELRYCTYCLLSSTVHCNY